MDRVKVIRIMTRREKICSLLISYLQGISVANGYLTNIGGYVSHWDVQIMKHADIYEVNVKDQINEHALGHIETLNVKISLSCKTSTNYATINKMILDVHKCLYNNQAAMGTALSENGLRILAEQEIIDLPIIDKDTKKAYAEVGFNIQHRFSERWTPDLTVY